MVTIFPCLGVIDAARVEQICTFNSYGAQNMFDRLNLDVDEEGIIEKTPCGLWTLPSFINHSCLGMLNYFSSIT